MYVAHAHTLCLEVDIRRSVSSACLTSSTVNVMNLYTSKAENAFISSCPICYLLKIKSETVYVARFMNDLVPNKVPIRNAC